MRVYLKSTDNYNINDAPFPRGEIVIVGDAVFQHYYQLGEPEESKLCKQQLGITDPKIGAYCTGDVGQFNFITGELEIVDRLKSIVKLSQGEFVQLATIEQVLGKIESVNQTYCYAQSYMNSLIGIL